MPRTWSSSVEGDTTLPLRFPSQQKARSLVLVRKTYYTIKLT